jgi:hypothetical protein
MAAFTKLEAQRPKVAREVSHARVAVPAATCFCRAVVVGSEAGRELISSSQARSCATRAREARGVHLQVPRRVACDVLGRNVREAGNLLWVAVFGEAHPSQRDILKAGSKQAAVLEEVGYLPREASVETVVKRIPCQSIGKLRVRKHKNRPRASRRSSGADRAAVYLCASSEFWQNRTVLPASCWRPRGTIIPSQ